MISHAAFETLVGLPHAASCRAALMQIPFFKVSIVHVLFATLASGCAVDATNDFGTDADADPQALVASDADNEWVRLAAQLVMEEKVATPQAARVYGYIGLSVHEAAQAGRRGSANQTWATKVVGLDALRRSGRGTHKAAISVAQSTAAVLASLVPSPAAKLQIDALLTKQLAQFKTSSAIARRSIAFGDAVAAVLIARSQSDGFAATRNLPYTAPVGLDKFSPVGGIASPLEPYWGTLKTVSSATTAADCLDSIPPPVPFSTEPNSSMYAQALSTFNTVNNSTPQEEQTAYHWADSPAQTSTPPGHWIELAVQEGRRANLSLLEAAELHGLVGVAEMDAFITGWHIKYTYNLIRPENYIQTYIDATWKPRLGTPPFPEYISGHAIGSNAAATVLTKFFGDSYAFTDLTRVGVVVKDAGGTPRTLTSREFPSFQAAADEAATSRLYGGMHFPMGSINGLLAGSCVGNTVLRAVK
jgi:PAP2 superfamily